MKNSEMDFSKPSPFMEEACESWIRVCADCYEEIQRKRAGDEVFDYCESCQQVEGNTLKITAEELERRQS